MNKLAPERARERAKIILGAVAHGQDPASQKTAERGTPTVSELADRFMADHVKAKRKSGTAEFYRDILDRIVKPRGGYHESRQTYSSSRGQAAFVTRKHTFSGESHAGGGG